MSFHTQSKKMHTAGRSNLTSDEKKYNVPWYNSKEYAAQREAIKGRVARKNKISHEKALARKKKKDEMD